MGYKRELTDAEKKDSYDASLIWGSSQFMVDYAAYRSGYCEALSSLPPATEIAQLKADNEKLRQALADAYNELQFNNWHQSRTGLKTATILSETKTINA